MLLLAILSSCFLGENEETTQTPAASFDTRRQATRQQTKDTTQTPAASFDSLILGTWQDLNDKKSKIKITKKTYIEYYTGEEPDVLSYKITNSCQCDNPDWITRSDKKDLLVTRDEWGCNCYGITKLNKNYLELGVPGKGLLRFKRIK